jgi:hypothetical protein
MKDNSFKTCDISSLGVKGPCVMIGLTLVILPQGLL